MADHDTEAREKKAFRRVVTASRVLAKQLGKPDLADSVATANHNDPSVEGMRRMEAIATLLEEVVAGKEEVKPVAKAKTDKE